MSICIDMCQYFYFLKCHCQSDHYVALVVDVEVSSSPVTRGNDSNDLCGLWVVTEKVGREVNPQGVEVVIECRPLLIHHLLCLQSEG